MAADGVDVQAPDFRRIIARAKEIEPKLATDLRRELRRSGGDIIAEQRAALGADGTVSSQIASGLRTRLTAGKTRQSIGIKSTGPRINGYNLARILERKTIRHPVYGRGDSWVETPGRPYFNPPIRRGAAKMRDRVHDIVKDITL